jgi:indolepyruvate ferredoxin oxidoreductase alpha subunit
MLGGTVPPELRILRLGTFYPLPAGRVAAFLRGVQSALVLEETGPLVERAVRAAAQERRLSLPIYGRDTGHLPRAGELFAPSIEAALTRLLPRPLSPAAGEADRPMPSHQPLCDGCPYTPTFDALVEAMDRAGGRDRFIVVGDPGCMVRAQLPPYELLDVKASLGSSIGIAAGIALSQCQIQGRTPGGKGQEEQSGENSKKRAVALCGDSSFLHTGLNGLVDAVRVGARMLVLILDNGTTALSGGQPHPASPVDARGRPRRAVDLAALAGDAGAGMVQVTDLDRGQDIGAAIERGIAYEGVAVVIARGQCPRWLAAL